jgi:hypothetical protein
MDCMHKVDRAFDTTTVLNTELNTPLKPAKSNLYSLASVWARRYVSAVAPAAVFPSSPSLSVDWQPHVGKTRETLRQILRLASAQAWVQTEQLLNGEMVRHGVDSELIAPWEIAADAHQIFEKTIQAYGDGDAADRVALMISNDCGQLRAKYTAHDPRLLGFVSMQCHYTGQSLLTQLDNTEKLLFTPYIKVLDDHLYMPLREIYLAAAEHDLDSEALRAVQRLLTVSSKIARKVCKRVRNRHPGYRSYSGRLDSAGGRISSIRDVEMFQIYLCLCLLEGNVRSVQEQLFPLCVMIYPRLNVSWELVQEMLEAMGWEMHKRLMPGDMMQFLPYLRTLSHMFSREVFTAVE